MKKTLLLLATFLPITCYLIPITSFSQPNWQWAKRAGGTGSDLSNCVAAGNSGTYVAGQFNSPTLVFGSTTLTNSGANDMFLTKYDAGGNAVWAKRAGGTSNEGANSIKVDASGNIYVAGVFSSSSIIFGSTTLTNASTGSYDIFLVKYDAGGTVQWAKRAGSTGMDQATSVALDALGNPYIAGYFNSTSLIFGSTTLTNTGTGTNDIFLAKYDPSGNVVWAKSAGGTSDDYATSVAVDTTGKICLTGYFTSASIVYSGTTLTNAGQADIFLAKYNASGTVLWVKSAGGPNNDESFSVAVDAAGNVYIAGWFISATLNFSGTPLSNPLVGYQSIFFTKYDANGNVTWVRTAVGTSNAGANSVMVDCTGNCYLAGSFQGSSITFGSTILSSWGNGEIYLSKYDASGTVLWAKGGGGTSVDYASSVASDPAGNIFLTGNFMSPAITLGSNTLTNADNTNTTYDLFLSKISFTVSMSHTNALCYAGNSGTATVYGTCGGAPNYTFLWNTSPPQTTQTATGLVSGNYSVTVTDLNGGSATANVTITQPALISSNNPQTICEGYIYLLNGHTYTTAGTYHDTLTANNGCDSIVNTILTVNLTDSTLQAHTICEGNIYNFYGTNLTTAGVYYHSLIGSNTCDSIIKLTLAVNPVDTTLISQAICDGSIYSFYGTNLTIDGTYYHNIISSNNCDSIITLVLTVYPLPPAPAITLNNDTLYSDVPTGNQWYSDNGIIAGANGQTFTPPSTNHYYVFVTDVNGCVSDTSNIIYVAFVGLRGFAENDIIYIYPNPASDKITIVSPQQALLEISNIQGQLIKTTSTNGSKTNIDISSLPGGVYVIEVITEKGVVVKKFMKE